MQDIVTTPVSERFHAALAYASALHAGQLRKGTRIPYVAHLLAVTTIVLEAGGTEDEAIAALLHDGPEDQGGEVTLDAIGRRFGDEVGAIVAACSDTFEDPKPPWEQRKRAYREHLLHAGKSALLVSIADKLHNARATLRDVRAEGPQVWDRFSATREQVIDNYRGLIDVYAKAVSDARREGLLAELRSVVHELAGVGFVESPAKAAAAERWFGYGRWDAPYWFIGKEPGGSDDPEQYASWERLGAPELLDCREHDLDCAADGKVGQWHGGDRPRLQGTWRPLIAMTLAFEGADAYDEDAVRAYQDARWGTRSGNTAVLELSAIAAPSVAHAEALRLTHLDDRISMLRRRIAEHAPKFVVFYGLGTDPVYNKPYLDHWSTIAGRELVVDEPVVVGQTIYVAERHPVAHGTTNAHWVELGKRLRSIVDRGL